MSDAAARSEPQDAPQERPPIVAGVASALSPLGSP